MQYVLKQSEHPPIMNSASWTLAAPFKEQRYHRSPSESIANNYTPTVQDLKIKDLVRQTKRPRKGFTLVVLFATYYLKLEIAE